jgi:DNA-binding LytR/AlgR family response regulator
MNAITALVVDDEPLARRRITRMLAAIDWVGRVDEAGNIHAAKELITEHKPQILLLDIQMPGGSGFELLNSLGDYMPKIIFVTAFDHYALRAFEAQAVDYVTKPIDPTRFAMAMERARHSVQSQTQIEHVAELQEALATIKRALNEKSNESPDFWIKSHKGYLRIPAEHILYLQADRDYATLVVQGAQHSYPESLASLARRLDPHDFWRVHRSTIVRRDAIVRVRHAAFGALVLILSDQSEIRVGKTFLPKIRSALNR